MNDTFPNKPRKNAVQDFKPVPCHWVLNYLTTRIHLHTLCRLAIISWHVTKMHASQSTENVTKRIEMCEATIQTVCLATVSLCVRSCSWSCSYSLDSDACDFKDSCLRHLKFLARTTRGFPQWRFSLTNCLLSAFTKNLSGPFLCKSSCLLKPFPEIAATL